MRKEVKHFGMSAKAILMVMVVFGTLFSSCYTKDDIPVVQKPEVVPNKYVIEGTIVTNNNGQQETLKGVTVTSDKNGVVTSGDANFIVTVPSPDIYTLTLTKDGYDNITYKVVVPSPGDQITGQLISVNVQLTMYLKNTSNPGEGQVGTSGGTVTQGNATLEIPAGALAANTNITMNINSDVQQAIEVNGTQEAAAQFLLGEFGPSGTIFSSPVAWSVAYPSLANYYLANTQLQYRANNGAGDWTILETGVIFENGKYNVNLTHFSQYRMVYRASSMNSNDVVENLPAIAPITNETAGTVQITEIPYEKYEGGELEFAGTEWTTLGADLDQIKNLVTEAVKAKVQVDLSGFNGPVAAVFQLRDPISLLYDYHLLSKGTQDINYYTFTFKVYDKNTKTEVTLTVNAKVAGKVSISVQNEFCGAHHTHGHCGHIYNGGAGGGMVIGD